MICPKCGYETSGNFCSNCGALLKRGDLQTDREHTDRQEGTGRRVRAWAPGGGKADSEAAVSAGRGDAAMSAVSAERGDAAMSAVSAEQDRAAIREVRAEASRIQQRNRMESREERRENLRKKEKPGAVSGKAAGKKSPATSGTRSPGKKEIRLEQREKKLRDSRMRDLESEVERLTVQERLRERRRREDGEQEDLDSGPGLGELAAKGAAGLVVLISRVMQLVSCLLMVSMVLTMLRSFLAHVNGLGEIRFLVTERNYGLALYMGAAGVSLFMGVIWCLWILSKKGAGGGFRLKKYDTGRGLIPFLLCAAVVFGAGPALSVLPPASALVEEWQGIAAGAVAFLTAIQVHRAALLFSSGAGAVLSLIRRILLV